MAEETKDAAGTEMLTEEVLDGKVDMGAESETASDSSTEKTEGQGTPGDGEKTPAEGAEPEAKPDDEVKEGQPIPYTRFKQVNDKFKGVEAELKEARGFLDNPDVFRAILIAKGVTDPAIQDVKLKEAGFEVKAKPAPESDVFKQITEGQDLNTKEGWMKTFRKAFDVWGKELTEPINKKLSASEAKEKNIVSETAAKKLAKDTYKLEYGKAGKDEENPNTAIGKMWAYLKTHPEDAYMGHSKILRLALSEEGFQLGKQQGVEQEKTRTDGLKRSAMETGEETVREDVPNGEWSVHRLMEFKRTHPNAQ